ncbi:hypothetical protein AN641_01710 [Candidatus Epulonipiscioides gigas]|nr:hypothetical protein AN641_01710 [Epulopiscium sp. SCG-C07WGA-EpuloA2]
MEEPMDEDFTQKLLYTNDKKDLGSISIILLGFTLFLASMLSAGALGIELEFKDFIISVIVGNIILYIYTSLLVYISSHTGLTIYLLSKYSFGEKGSYLVSILLGTIQVGWFSVGVAMFAIPLEKITGIPIITLIMISGMLMTIISYYRMKSLIILGIILIPLFVILGLWSVGISIYDVGGISNLLQIELKSIGNISNGISLCIATFISATMLFTDFTCYSNNKKTSLRHVITTVLISIALMFFFGMIDTMAIGKFNIFEIIFLQSLMVLVIILLGFNIWFINSNNLERAFLKIRKPLKNKFVIVNGVMGTLFTIVLYENFLGWLTFLNVSIPNIGAIIIADYFIINKSKYTKLQETSLEKVNVIAIISCGAGGLMAYFLDGIAPINAMVFSAIFYTVLTKMKSKYAINL